MSALPSSGASAGRATAQPFDIEPAHVALGQRPIFTLADPLRPGKLRCKHQERAEYHAQRNTTMSDLAP